jgi:hypothetical protein
MFGIQISEVQDVMLHGQKGYNDVRKIYKCVSIYIEKNEIEMPQQQKNSQPELRQAVSDSFIDI